MSESDWPGLVRKSDPDFHDPRFQRKIVKLNRLIPFIENVNEAVLECGHEPLILGDNPAPEVGMIIFCGDCRNEAKGSHDG